MTDETGGKPLLMTGTLILSPGAKDELARFLAPDHVTIPTAALTELLAAAEELCRKYALNMRIDPRLQGASEAAIEYAGAKDTNRLRAAVARVRGAS